MAAVEADCVGVFDGYGKGNGFLAVGDGVVAYGVEDCETDPLAPMRWINLQNCKPQTPFVHGGTGDVGEPNNPSLRVSIEAYARLAVHLAGCFLEPVAGGVVGPERVSGGGVFRHGRSLSVLGERRTDAAPRL
jgi:hypothetical protein